MADEADGSLFGSEPVDNTPTTSTTDIRRAAMDLLARREHSRGELVTKLRRRFPAFPEWIDEVIEKLADENLQSDARMAEAFVRSRINRGQGPRKVKAELRGRGIDDYDIELALEECEPDWHALAEQVYRKRFGDAPPADQKERAKRLRFLEGRGFSFDHISDFL